jgi:hypothetical protein
MGMFVDFIKQQMYFHINKKIIRQLSEIFLNT